MATFTGNGIMRLSLPSTLTSEFFIHIKVGVSKSFQNVNVLKSCLSGVASGISLHLANDELIANLIFNDGSVTLKAKLQVSETVLVVIIQMFSLTMHSVFCAWLYPCFQCLSCCKDF